MKNKSMISLVFVLALFLTAASHAENPNDVQSAFEKANHHYAAGEYDQAILSYELILGDVKSGAVDYNLGNAYFKTGRLGKAILHYRRAQNAMPADADLVHNLAFAESQLKQKQPEQKCSLLVRAWDATSNALPSDAWFVLSIVFFWFFCVLAMGFLFRRKSIREAAPLLLVAITLFCIAAGSLAGRVMRTHVVEAVVVVPKTDIRYSPSYDGAIGFELTEGLRVQILEVENGWTQIRLTGARSGWAEPGSIESIN